MPAVKYSHNYSEIHEQELPQKSSFVSVPVKKGYKTKNTNPSVKSKIEAANSTLFITSIFLALTFMTVYSIVASCETKLSNLHSKISELNYENIDLENKLENVKSYYSVDTKVSSTADFDKAKNVLEVNHVNAKTTTHIAPKSNNLNTVTGF